MTKDQAVRAQYGYSALELSVALMVLGVMALASVPAFSKFIGTDKLQGAGDKMTGRLRHARSLAITNEEPMIITWSTSLQTYSLVTDSNADGIAGAGEPVNGPHTLPTGVSLSNPASGNFPTNSVVFGISGSASTSGSLLLTDQRGHTVRVTVYQSTGLVEVANE